MDLRHHQVADRWQISAMGVLDPEGGFLVVDV